MIDYRDFMICDELNVLDLKKNKLILITKRIFNI